jgi:hypothetical protein
VHDVARTKGEAVVEKEHAGTSKNAAKQPVREEMRKGQYF